LSAFSEWIAPDCNLSAFYRKQPWAIFGNFAPTFAPYSSSGFYSIVQPFLLRLSGTKIVRLRFLTSSLFTDFSLEPFSVTSLPVLPIFALGYFR
jgi:hypothetical protein